MLATLMLVLVMLVPMVMLVLVIINNTNDASLLACIQTARLKLSGVWVSRKTMTNKAGLAKSNAEPDYYDMVTLMRMNVYEKKKYGSRKSRRRL